MLGSETGLNGAGAAFAPAVETPKKINNHITQKIGQPKSKHHARKIGTKTAKKAIGRAASKAFPASSFQEALTIADAIQAYSGGSGKIRRLTLFDALKKSPDSGPSRQLVTNSARYGLTTGSYKAEHLELTSKGNLATNVEGDPKEKLKARFELAISSVPAFKALYDKFAGNKLPAKPVMHDVLREAGIPDADLAECADAFIVNAKYLGLLKTLAGAECLLKIDHALEELPPDGKVVEFSAIPRPPLVAGAPPASAETSDWSKICFYITPIGDEDTDQRRHSDLFLNCVVEPAVTELGLKIVRADLIGKSGMIGPQLMEHVLRSRLVIVDLSFHNPNVFYELCLRHVSGLPTVHIIRQADKIPFDVQQCRTIPIDTTDIYSLVPKLETYRSEIAQQARQALENESQVAENPITVYFPGLKLQVPSAVVKGSEKAV
jgi:hypothetical protein